MLPLRIAAVAGAALLSTACASRTAKLMKVSRDAFHDALALAQGGQWDVAGRALDRARGHVERALADRPVAKTRSGPVLLPVLLESWKAAAWQPLDDALAAKDIAGFELAYARTARKCAQCHEAVEEPGIAVLPPGWMPPPEPEAGAAGPSLKPSPLPLAPVAAPPKRAAPSQDPLLPAVPRPPLVEPLPAPAASPEREREAVIEPPEPPPSAQ